MGLRFNLGTLLLLASLSGVVLAENRAELTVGNDGVNIGVVKQLGFGDAPFYARLGANMGVDEFLADQKAIVQSSVYLTPIGLRLSPEVKAGPTLIFKCGYPKDKLDCQARYGGQLLFGPDKGIQIGVGYSTGDGTSEFKDENILHLNISGPLSTNDEERLINSKGDMDFDKAPKKEEPASKARQA